MRLLETRIKSGLSYERNVDSTCSRPKAVCFTISMGLKDPTGILNSRRNLHALSLGSSIPSSISIGINYCACSDMQKSRTYCMRNLQLSAPLQVRVVSSWILSTIPNGMLVRLTKALNTMHMIYPSLDVVEATGVSLDYI